MVSVPLATLPAVSARLVDTDFAHVLLGIDFSSASLAAARWATTFVAPRAHAILSYIVPSPNWSQDDGLGYPKGRASRQVSPRLTGGLGGFAATLDVATADSVVRVGRPSRWLSSIANDAGVSLVVFGRRVDANRTRVGEPSVIERAARRVNASVLVVPEGTKHQLGHVVAAIDQSAFAPTVMRVAARLAHLHDVPLIMLHVLSPASGAYERVIRTGQYALRAAKTVRSSNRPAARNALPVRAVQWFLELARSQDPAARHRREVRMGDPTREIVAAAVASEASMIVVGARGADDAPPGSLGSVARELLTRAPVPVLAVRDS